MNVELQTRKSMKITQAPRLNSGPHERLCRHSTRLDSLLTPRWKKTRRTTPKLKPIFRHVIGVHLWIHKWHECQAISSPYSVSMLWSEHTKSNLPVTMVICRSSKFQFEQQSHSDTWEPHRRTHAVQERLGQQNPWLPIGQWHCRSKALEANHII